MKILLLEDCDLVAGLLIGVLEENGHMVTWFKSPGEIDNYRALCSNVDLIITDNRMPYVTGVEFLRQARKKGIKTKAIMHSGDDDPELINEVKSRLDCFFVSKASGNELFDLVRSFGNV